MAIKMACSSTLANSTVAISQPRSGALNSCASSSFRGGVQFECNARVVAVQRRGKFSHVCAQAADGGRGGSFSDLAVMVNDCSGKMGGSVAEAAIGAGLQLVPVCLTGPGMGRSFSIQGVNVEAVDSRHREGVIDHVLKEYPYVVVVDYTLPAAVNGNAEFYCSRGLPFVMGTTGGDSEKLIEDVLQSGVYSVVAPQMGKQVVAFQAAMSIMAEQFPGAFSGYKLQVIESHQSTKVDTSGTAKAIISSFQKLGLDFDMEEIEMVRDSKRQIEEMKVPEEHLNGHAFHTYRVVSPDGMVNFEFQHNVCGRSIYAEGAVDAVLFLAKKIRERTDKKLYNMIDVLREGNMR
ncbi:hypothetical protein KC19_7G085800 [Ceratodon purpureus]|uniref:4-hydroxy-tetrahydrodipicolinate reductase n=1 Tax=Ceratodon purpureus TaxID=3225 RepID=A0A8T0H7U8_CERPU|nr:hypothetical protein KC19_7G085800 [Ceratodon purpureus]